MNLHNSRSNKWTKCNTNNTRKPENRHRQTAGMVTEPHIGDTSTDDINRDGRSTTTEEPRHDECREVLCECRREERDDQDHICHEVSWHAAGGLSQRDEDQWPEGGAHVPGGGGPVQVWEGGVLDVEFFLHPVVAGTVGSCGETCEDGADGFC